MREQGKDNDGKAVRWTRWQRQRGEYTETRTVEGTHWDKDIEERNTIKGNTVRERQWRKYIEGRTVRGRHQERRWGENSDKKTMRVIHSGEVSEWKKCWKNQWEENWKGREREEKMRGMQWGDDVEECSEGRTTRWWICVMRDSDGEGKGVSKAINAYSRRQI